MDGISFALGFPLMLMIVFGSITFTVQKKKDDDDDDLPPTGMVALSNLSGVPA